MNIKISERLEKSTLRIYEGLCKIAESASTNELNEKINTIMDALGLEYDKFEDTSETSSTKKDEPTDEEPEVEAKVETKETPAGTETEDTFTVEEGKESLQGDENKVEVSEVVDNDKPKKKYSIIFHRDMPNVDWFEEDLGFDTFDEFIKFVDQKLPIRLSYREEELMEQKDSEVESGVIFSNLWFDIVKNAEGE